MRMRCGNHIRASRVNARVDGKRREIDFGMAFDNFAVMIHQHKIGNANLAKVQTERVDPEMIEPLRIARSDVAGNAFIKAKARKEAKGCGEALFAVTALLGRIGENGRARDAVHEGAVGWRSG
jgi:hypothetical protein